jgi:multiple sugar transport system ATP-binding protein
MDEPLSNLDAKLRVATRAEIAALQAKLGVTTLYVTHDQIEAMTMGHRVAVMKDGVLLQCDTPRALYQEPVNAFVAGFIGSPPMNLLPFEGSLRRGDRSVDYFDCRIDVPEVREDIAKSELTLGVRPEHVVLSESGPIRGRVFAVEYLGTNQIVTVDIDRAKVKARLSSRAAAKVGETVGVSFHVQKLVVFNSVTGRATQSALFEDWDRG